jgi:hypothetical protein
MTDPATTPLHDTSDARPMPQPRLLLLAADDAVVCVDDLCLSPGDADALAGAPESPEPAR